MEQGFGVPHAKRVTESSPEAVGSTQNAVGASPTALSPGHPEEAGTSLLPHTHIPQTPRVRVQPSPIP